AADVQAEHDFELRRLLNPLPTDYSTDFYRQAGHRLLDRLLDNRGISPAEYHLGRVRNAHLRKLAEARLTFTEAELDREYARSFGPRVRVRHIQLASPAEAERVRGLLDAGADFAELARRYSANTLTAGAGGLLEPFSADDTEVPPLLREAAFDLPVGRVSNPLRVGNWVHLVRVDERLPQSDLPRDRVRDRLEKQLRQRRLPDEMQRISAEKFERARIRILDPQLEAEFQKRHPDRGRQSE
ncbi:MAG: peptidyl-prolyl cis-trans isomerase, partial [Planctomycetes bacterium]|nr:peptidyl-prolyl cis-trans isomerase [Planctomycetota bacterium]